MAYTASALSFMLAGFGKPIVLTGSQLPLAMARSDARQNLIDSITCATSRYANGPMFNEVAICFGGKLLRGNRAQKTHTNTYGAFDSLTYPPLAMLGVEVGDDCDDAKAYTDMQQMYADKAEHFSRPHVELRRLHGEKRRCSTRLCHTSRAFLSTRT